MLKWWKSVQVCEWQWMLVAHECKMAWSPLLGQGSNYADYTTTITGSLPWWFPNFQSKDARLGHCHLFHPQKSPFSERETGNHFLSKTKLPFSEGEIGNYFHSKTNTVLPFSERKVGNYSNSKTEMISVSNLGFDNDLLFVYKSCLCWQTRFWVDAIRLEPKLPASQPDSQSANPRE